jgi:hypothetical protein
LRLLQIVGAQLEPTEQDALRRYLDEIEREYNEKFLNLWSDISSNNVRLNFVTRNNKTFAICGKGWAEERNRM